MDTLFDVSVHLSPSQAKILHVLKAARGGWVSGRELNDYAFAYSQRIGELITKGYNIERGRDGNLGQYRLVTL